MGIEPTYSAWKADALADVLHPHIFQHSFLNRILDSWKVGLQNLHVKAEGI